MARKQRICWLDVESNGTVAGDNVLLQVAIRVTDQNLNFVDEEDGGYESKIYYSQQEVKDLIANTNPYVIDMHTKTGLWGALSTDGKPLKVVESEVMDYLNKYIPEPQSSRLGGNSITLDRNFINTFLPKVGKHLHYRSFDVSTIAGMVEIFAGSRKMYKKETTHEAMDDITQSIEEFRYYRDLLFPDFVNL